MSTAANSVCGCVGSHLRNHACLRRAAIYSRSHCSAFQIIALGSKIPRLRICPSGSKTCSSGVLIFFCFLFDWRHETKWSTHIQDPWMVWQGVNMAEVLRMQSKNPKRLVCFSESNRCLMWFDVVYVLTQAPWWRGANQQWPSQWDDHCHSPPWNDLSDGQQFQAFGSFELVQTMFFLFVLRPGKEGHQQEIGLSKLEYQLARHGSAPP